VDRNPADGAGHDSFDTTGVKQAVRVSQGNAPAPSRKDGPGLLAEYAES